VERVTQPMYVLNKDRIVEREITFTPGLYKVFDEIVVNACKSLNKQPS
jgi:DNA topoisomerase-2